jgi:hypothetical protein
MGCPFATRALPTAVSAGKEVAILADVLVVGSLFELPQPAASARKTRPLRASAAALLGTAPREVKVRWIAPAQNKRRFVMPRSPSTRRARLRCGEFFDVLGGRDHHTATRGVAQEDTRGHVGAARIRKTLPIHPQPFACRRASPTRAARRCATRAPPARSSGHPPSRRAGPSAHGRAAPFERRSKLQLRRAARHCPGPPTSRRGSRQGTTCNSSKAQTSGARTLRNWSVQCPPQVFSRVAPLLPSGLYAGPRGRARRPPGRSC